MPSVYFIYYVSNGGLYEYTCKALLNSTSDIPSLGLSLESRTTDGITVLSRLYMEQTPHRAIVQLCISVGQVTRFAKSTAKRLLASETAGRPIGGTFQHIECIIALPIQQPKVYTQKYNNTHNIGFLKYNFLKDNFKAVGIITSAVGIRALRFNMTNNDK